MELIQRKLTIREGKPLYIYCISDIQYCGEDSAACMDTLNAVLDEAKERDAYFLFTGDAVDTVSPSNRSKIQAANFYDTTKDFLDASGRGLCDQLYDRALHKMRDRTLAWVEGHHWMRFEDGTTTDTYLCQKLRAPFAGTSCFLNLQLATRAGQHGSVVFFLHHGVGSSRKVGGPMNRLEDMLGAFDADVYVMGHNTRRVTAPVDFLTVNWNTRGGPRLHHKRKQLIQTGGFARGYEQGSKLGNKPSGSYVEQALYRPSTLGPAVIRITPRWKPWRFDLRVES